MQKTFDTDTYYIAYNDEKIHCGLAKEGTQVATQMPNYEEYDTENKWKERLEELGYDMSRFDEELMEE